MATGYPPVATSNQSPLMFPTARLVVDPHSNPTFASCSVRTTHAPLARTHFQWREAVFTRATAATVHDPSSPIRSITRAPNTHTPADQLRTRREPYPTSIPLQGNRRTTI